MPPMYQSYSEFEIIDFRRKGQAMRSWTLKLPADLADELVAAAQDRGAPMSAFARQLLADGFRAYCHSRIETLDFPSRSEILEDLKDLDII